MYVSDFDFTLPEELIAQTPLDDRAASRMLVVDRARGTWVDRAFRDLPSYFGPGDCLALNETRVFPARLLGHRAGFTGEVEALLVRALPDSDGLNWLCLVRPGRKIRTGDRLVFGETLEAVVLGRNDFGERTLRFVCEPGELAARIDAEGHIPLPPYIGRSDRAEDRDRYQTVYAGDARGSVAAPTAGLHFTPEVLEACRERGAETARLTLHVGLGTFAPLRAERVEDVKLHAEWFDLRAEEAAKLAAARRRVAVGTTSVRTLETVLARTGGEFRALSGDTDIFISPGFDFQATGALLTNFHLPQSSLLMLVCALAGRELTLAAYRHAVEARYRFYSYGDCMLIV
ncbi:MAG: tRNA preQ1(34) S-adenosylmethionine ribosyltransferase-isomerase QueA [Acidobacteria bacterium]|nr:tRNA preQ1(34) S-adenosylmethionine ribosyltransferase-isomerase QueA [Acidobacteriota bacterium]